MDWRPIETAATVVGARVLGWNKYDGVLVYEAYQFGSNKQFSGWGAVYDMEEIAGAPTHWMPLPEPPHVP